MSSRGYHSVHCSNVQTQCQSQKEQTTQTTTTQIQNNQRCGAALQLARDDDDEITALPSIDLVVNLTCLRRAAGISLTFFIGARPVGLRVAIKCTWTPNKSKHRHTQDMHDGRTLPVQEGRNASTREVLEFNLRAEPQRLARSTLSTLDSRKQTSSIIRTMVAPSNGECSKLRPPDPSGKTTRWIDLSCHRGSMRQTFRSSVSAKKQPCSIASIAWDALRGCVASRLRVKIAVSISNSVRLFRSDMRWIQLRHSAHCGRPMAVKHPSGI